MTEIEKQLAAAGVSYESNQGVGCRITIANRVVSIHERDGYWVVMTAICGAHLAPARLVLELAATVADGSALALVSGHYVVRRVILPGTRVAEIARRVASLAADIELAIAQVRDRATRVDAHYCA